jgi:hypothetical protein
MCFGYMPPLRDNSVLLTITKPPHHGCIHEDCQHKAGGCHGNRAFRHAETGGWHLDIPHHKNTRRWNGKSIKLALPSEVGELLEHHITWGHRLLTMCVDDPTPTLFINKSTGAPLRPQEVSKVWSKTVLDGSGVHFGPHMCRSIFVVGTKDRGMPCDPGMAMVMGSSSATIWERVYDKHFNNRQVESAMDAMATWRKTMLDEANASMPKPSKKAKHTEQS